MKHRILIIMLSLPLFLSACSQGIEKSALEICSHLSFPEMMADANAYLTEDYFIALRDMAAMTDSVPVLHEWEFWFVASDGSAIKYCRCEVVEAERVDNANAQVVVRVFSPTEGYDSSDHKLLLEWVGRRWLLADFDETRGACLRRLGYAWQD